MALPRGLEWPFQGALNGPSKGDARTSGKESCRDYMHAMLADLKLRERLRPLTRSYRPRMADISRLPRPSRRLLQEQVELRNTRRLQTAMRSSRLLAIKTLEDFDFSFQPSIKRQQIDSLHRGWASSSAKRT